MKQADVRLSQIVSRLQIFRGEGDIISFKFPVHHCFGFYDVSV